MEGNVFMLLEVDPSTATDQEAQDFFMKVIDLTYKHNVICHSNFSWQAILNAWQYTISNWEEARWKFTGCLGEWVDWSSYMEMMYPVLKARLDKLRKIISHLCFDDVIADKTVHTAFMQLGRAISEYSFERIGLNKFRIHHNVNGIMVAMADKETEIEALNIVTSLDELDYRKSVAEEQIKS